MPCSHAERAYRPQFQPVEALRPLGGEDCAKQDYAVLIVVGLPAKLELPRADNATLRKQAPAPLDSSSVRLPTIWSQKTLGGRKRAYQE
jgi:hypothetical protein